VLCLAGQTTPTEEATRIVDAFLKPGSKRASRAAGKQNGDPNYPHGLSLRGVDPEIYEVIERERRRQQENIELIASETLRARR